MIKLLTIIISIVALTYSQNCVPWTNDITGFLFICTAGQSCSTFPSTQRMCFNLVGDDWASGASLSVNYQCRVFQQANCFGSFRVATHIRNNFGFNARSFDCPWRC